MYNSMRIVAMVSRWGQMLRVVLVRVGKAAHLTKIVTTPMEDASKNTTRRLQAIVTPEISSTEDANSL
jgi:hypothetical protein